jgi:lipopolysaccharide biosynthesis glycosyltransferase
VNLPSSNVTFFCCIEAGILETGVLQLAQSIRSHAGKYASSRILAIKPRAGLPISGNTRRKLNTLNVEFIDRSEMPEFSWFNFMNKPKAFVIAEEIANTEILVWLDSDTLILQEPNAFTLDAAEQVAACVTDKNIGTSGPKDSNYLFWQHICSNLRLPEIEEFPWVETGDTGEKIRAYWNSGVVVFRADIGFARRYFDMCNQYVQSRALHHEAGIFYTDQIALSATIMKYGLKWKNLPLTHNFTLRPEICADDPALLQQAAVLHYRGSMWENNWDALMGSLEKYRPEAKEWIQNLGPWRKPPRNLLSRALLKTIQTVRNAQQQKYIAQCRVISPFQTETDIVSERESANETGVGIE